MWSFTLQHTATHGNTHMWHFICDGKRRRNVCVYVCVCAREKLGVLMNEWLISGTPCHCICAMTHCTRDMSHCICATTHCIRYAYVTCLISYVPWLNVHVTCHILKLMHRWRHSGHCAYNMRHGTRDMSHCICAMTHCIRYALVIWLISYMPWLNVYVSCHILRLMHRWRHSGQLRGWHDALHMWHVSLYMCHDSLHTSCICDMTHFICAMTQCTRYMSHLETNA